MSNYAKGWHDGMSTEETKNLAYWERNMLALLLADYSNRVFHEELKNRGVPKDVIAKSFKSGWYYDRDNNWDGWKRVISIENGEITFHVPDNFDMGNLPEIKPNWNGLSTEDKWRLVMAVCGCKELPKGEEINHDSSIDSILEIQKETH